MITRAAGSVGSAHTYHTQCTPLSPVLAAPIESFESLTLDMPLDVSSAKTGDGPNTPPFALSTSGADSGDVVRATPRSMAGMLFVTEEEEKKPEGEQDQVNGRIETVNLWYSQEVSTAFFRSPDPQQLVQAARSKRSWVRRKQTRWIFFREIEMQ